MLPELASIDRRVDDHPDDVARRAAELVRAARAASDHETAAVAGTLRARALRNLREVELAEQAIDDALVSAELVGGDVLADAHLVAASVATFRRGAAQSSSHLLLAEHHGSSDICAKVLVQRSVLAQREGRLAEALTLFDLVIPRLREIGDPVRTARVLSNRAIASVLVGRTKRAIADFSEARALFESSGQRHATVIVDLNTAWASLNAGDVPGALTMLDRVLVDGADFGDQIAEATVSRAEALMAVGLFADASDLLSDVARRSFASGDQAHSAEALLLLASSERLAGSADASIAARRALGLFEALGLHGPALQARLELFRSEFTSGESGRSLGLEATRLADQLAGAGLRRAEIEARSLAALILVRCGEIERAQRCARRCVARAADLPFVEHRLASAHAAAVVDAATGDRPAALLGVMSALAEFDAYRSTIGSPDARGASAMHAAALSDLGAALVVEAGNAADVLAWSERRRSAVRSWRDPNLAGAPVPSEEADTSDVAELRSLLSELREVETSSSASGRSEGELLQRRHEVENRVRDRLLGDGATVKSSATKDSPIGVGVDLGRFDDTVAVSIDRHGGAVYAVIVHASRTQLVMLGAAADLDRLVRTTSTLLAAAARSTTTSTRRPSRRLRAAVARLDDWVSAAIPAGGGPVVIAMPPDLQSAPWSMTNSLRDRAVSFVPSLSDWSPGPHPATDERRPLTALAGPRLGHADVEVALVAAASPKSIAWTGSSGTSSRLIDALASTSTLHIAAHTHIRRDNPMWSTIELADGSFFLHELAGRPVRSELVVLSSCESAVNSGPAGGAIGGFSAALLGLGARAVVATVSVLPDDDLTPRCLADFHHEIAGGKTPAAALAEMRRRHDDEVAPYALACWGGR